MVGNHVYHSWPNDIIVQGCEDVLVCKEVNPSQPEGRKKEPCDLPIFDFTNRDVRDLM
jgi:hypothetical protein